MSSIDAALESLDHPRDISITGLARLLAQEKIDPSLTSDKLGIFEVKEKSSGREKLGIFFVEFLRSLIAEERKLYSPDPNKPASLHYKEANEPPTEEQKREISKKESFSELVTYLTRIFYLPQNQEERQKILRRYTIRKGITVHQGLVENKRESDSYEFREENELNNKKTEKHIEGSYPEFPQMILTIIDKQCTLDDEKEKEAKTGVRIGTTLTIDFFPYSYTHYPGIAPIYKADGRDIDEVCYDLGSKRVPRVPEEKIRIARGYAAKHQIASHFNLTLTDSDGNVKSELKGSFMEKDKDTFGFEFGVPKLPDLKFFVPMQRFGGNFPPSINLLYFSNAFFDLCPKPAMPSSSRDKKPAQKVTAAV